MNSQRNWEEDMSNLIVFTAPADGQELLVYAEQNIHI